MSVITVGFDKDGQEVKGTVNDRLVLKLPENPTTGVRWDFEHMDGPMRLVGDEYETPQEGSGIGAAAVRVLTLQPSGPGAALLKLRRWQAWEGEASIDATFSCTVNIEHKEIIH